MSRARAAATTTGTGRGAVAGDCVAAGGRACRDIAQGIPTAATTIAAAAAAIRHRLCMRIRSPESNAYARGGASVGGLRLTPVGRARREAHSCAAPTRWENDFLADRA